MQYVSFPLYASLAEGEAVLRFPYDERLRQLLRAIPGRRWDPHERVWCVPLDPEPAEALARLLASLPGEPQVSEALTRTLERRRRRRRTGECVVDRVRPDGEWWLGFPTDTAPELAEALMEHPEAYAVPAIGRAQIPLDELAARLVGELSAHSEGLRLSEDARRALLVLRVQGRREARSVSRGAAREEADVAARLGALDEVALCRDRRGRQWIVLAAEHAPLARVLAGRAGLHAGDGPAGTYALAAVEHDATQIAELLDQLEASSVDPRVSVWLERATEWRGNIEVGGSGEEPVFLLLGNPERLPPDLRERAASVPGGASVPLTLESWRLMEGRLRGWTQRRRERCVAALRDGRPAPPAVLELSTVHEEPTFVLAPGHDPAQLEAVRGAGGDAAGQAAARRRARARAPARDPRRPVLRPGARRASSPSTGRGWTPQALELLQEIREEHARAAGLVALSAATDASLQVPGLGGELKPFQRAG